MRVTRHRRQILLFLAAILLPATVLIGLAARLMYQDRELAAKRSVDQRRAAVDQLRRELTSRLDALKLEEINRLIRQSDAKSAGGSQNPAVIFTARLENDRLVLPWDLPWDAPAQTDTLGSQEFAQHIQAGETAELAKNDYAAAAAEYRQALANIRHPWEGAEARLRLARTLAKAGNSEEAARQYRALLDDPILAREKARDEQGVGYRFYAAERLLNYRKDPTASLSFLARELNGDEQLTSAELYMIRTLLDSLPDSEAAQLRQRLSGRIDRLEQARMLARDFPRILAQVESGAPTGAVWVPYGSEPWLVTTTPAAAPLPRLAIAVSAASIAPPGVKLLNRSGQGDAVGEAFPGLRVEWSDKRFWESSRPGLPFAIWIAGLALVLGVAVFGGYLLLRDVNRDVRMTEVRSQFVASVSHELKTPLTAIRMFAETLAMGRSRDEQTKAEYLETIVNESERLARLVDNVLDFSKIEQGKKIYRPRPTRLEDVAGSAVRAMRFPLAQQGFELHLSIQEDLPEMQADPDAIQQAILNLLTNAMKYSGDAREIDLRLYERNGDAVIEVADHGLGLAPDEQKRVFEKFYRAPSHERHLIAGTGLGLTLVAHIVQAHGGRVEVESALGAGSTFCVFIPIKPVPMEARA